MITKQIRNVGIVAHVDAGKTTLTEQLIYNSGSSKVLGSVDKGTTHTDIMDIEKQRGISVKSSEIDLCYENTEIHLIDTPGHVDFTGEVERSLGVLDGAIVVVSSVESVKPQTEVYFKALNEMNIPSIFFINKIDRLGSDYIKTIEDVKKLLTTKVIPLEIVSNDVESYKITDLFSIINDLSDDKYSELIEDIVSTLGENNEEIIEEYYNETLTLEKIKNEIIIQCKEGKVYPLFIGSALKGIGINNLLDGIINYLPAPRNLDHEPFSALVYKISHDKNLGRISHLKIFSGILKVRDDVINVNKNSKEKITIMKKIIQQRECDIKEASSGDIVMVANLSCNTYDILGNSTYIPNVPNIANPLLTLRVYPLKNDDYIPLVEALNILESEDPLLNVLWIKEKKEIHIHIMGTIQLEILENVLKDRFSIDVTFGEPSVIYKETPIDSGYAIEEYTMPKPCWAIVKFLIEPLPLESGIVFETQVRTDKIKIKYQREIENNLTDILKEGYLGWNVTDLKITLLDGEDHVMHSRPGDFKAATAMALMKGFRDIGMTLLEPIIDFKISINEELGGRVLNDIIQMRGNFNSPTVDNGIFTVTGTMPVSTSLNYAVTLGIMSSGKAMLSTKFHGYEPCPIELGKKKEHTHVNPLDRSKYILYVRNAL